MPPTSLFDYDVAIIGAGPAGAACALGLRQSGLRVALLDKAQFPRDKVCGDAIPGHALKALRQLDPAFADSLWQLQPLDAVRQSRLVAPNGGRLDLQWKLPSFNCPRETFDAALLALVRTHAPATVILENTALKSLAMEVDHVRLQPTLGPEITCQLVIGCDGANSAVGRKLLPEPRLARAHHCVGVRAYFESIAGAESGTTEFFLTRDYLAGYIWLFPVGGGRYNVGLGMLAEVVAQHKVDLKETMTRLLATHPALAGRFAGARQLGPIVGFGLPLGGGRVRPISGERFILCGDAASLIDPLQGHGIDTAIQSGILAAGQAEACFKKQEYGAEFIQQYDAQVAEKIGRKLAKSYRLMRFLSNKAWLVNAAVSLAKVPGLKPWVQKAIG
ncbi:geranylgeranyl reductase family protein [Hymenobacter sp. BT683]|uniref:Geranylgeranyl reductase family protein n=1 Tax=Hymenobacter jeongseonensis TaxID=2791027 RepID=A0ABS0IIX2_9BACT|nr:geranylgeranyl reductase family protein [Hymenobacter jeongseonensis]MBF9238286.1 geranylgeranyl reductase family protein [Hymenobacter jeongseonensis]